MHSKFIGTKVNRTRHIATERIQWEQQQQNKTKTKNKEQKNRMNTRHWQKLHQNISSATTGVKELNIITMINNHILSKTS